MGSRAGGSSHAAGGLGLAGDAGSSVRRLSSSSSRGGAGLLGGLGVAAAVVAWVLDTELSGPLVLAGALDDEKETVVGDVVLEIGGGGPDKAAIVGDGLGNRPQRLDIGAGPAEEDQRDGTLGGGGPLNSVWLADGNLGVQGGLDDGIALGTFVVVWRGVRCDQSREGSDDGSKRETHYFSGISGIGLR